MAEWWRKRRVRPLPDELELGGRVLYLVDDAAAMRQQLGGSDLEPGRLPPLRHDISTDEITPARVCYHFDSTLGEFPYTGLVAGGERPVAPGAVRLGGFVASVSGRRRGKGSSREASPFAELSAGIRLAVAESFERIYEANCTNLGMLTTSDPGVIDLVRGGGRIPLAAFVAGKDPIAAETVRLGGLFAYNVARLQGRVAPPPPSAAPRPMTLAEKILAAHWRHNRAIGTVAVAPGDAGFAAVDLRFSHEYVTPMSAAFWDHHVGPGVAPTDPSSMVCFRDHLALLGEVLGEDDRRAGVPGLVAELVVRQASFAHRHGVRVIDAGAPDGGICHTVVLERYALPGQIVLGTDSHTCQAGALGCLAIGCGATAMFNAWFTRDVRVQVPPTVRVELAGTPSGDVTAKDVMLLLLADPGVRAGAVLGSVLEFTGDGVRAMAVDERATLTNMAAEAGAFSGIIQPDGAVVDLLADRGTPRGEAARLVGAAYSDPGCEYARILTLDLAELEPLVAEAGDPGNGRPARECAGIGVNIAYVGSCTGGKRADIDLAAAVFRWGIAHGLRVHRGVRCFVQCASAEVQRQCEQAGHTEVFRAVGATVLPPGCGACINAGPGISRRPEDVTISSINRNFPGRSGPGRMLLASPSTVAASALAGQVSTWPGLRQRVAP